MRAAKAALEDAMALEANSRGRSDVDVDGLERAIAARDLEIFKREGDIAALREELAKAEERRESDETKALERARANEEAMREDVERANARAMAAEDGARAMREALKAFELRVAREKVELKDALREARRMTERYALELERERAESEARERARARSNDTASGSGTDLAVRREVEILAKKLEVSAAVNVRLESLATQKAEEVFNITQERDALKKKLRTTSETIDALEKDWQEFSRQGQQAQGALRAENDELHALVDALKDGEKQGFAEAENEIAALKEELETLRKTSAPKVSDSVLENRSVDRRLARESIAALRGKIRELREELNAKSLELEELKRARTMDASSDVVVGRDINALDELEAVTASLRRENAKLRQELDAVDPDLFEESILLKRRVTAQDMLLASYEERLTRYTEALGIPFEVEPRP